MMEQYLEIKSGYKHCLLFFRLGDFYELFFDDALIASKVLDITLTGKDCGMEERAPMCGVPFHSADTYIAKLVANGFRVAICEQVENPKLTKTLVKRDVVRVVTPGTQTDINALEANKNNYIMAVFEGKNGYGIAVADVSTGEFLAAGFALSVQKRVNDEIARFTPSEIITNAETIIPTLPQGTNVSPFTSKAQQRDTAYAMLLEHFNVNSLSSYGIEDDPACICASGMLLDYLTETQKNALSHIRRIRRLSDERYMILDASSRRNLELTETMREKSKQNTLFDVLDQTKTSMGARTLRKWIEQPLLNVSEINYRSEAVGELKENPITRAELREHLATISDLERLLSKIVYETANARDLSQIKGSITCLPQIGTLVSQLQASVFKEISKGYDSLSDIQAMIATAIQDEPPVTVREGGMFRDGFNAELDELRRAKTDGAKWISELETNEREQTGIKNLKIRYNKVFGYYIEITNAHNHLAPERYIRRQTLANSERYITEELKRLEEIIMGADEKITELEYSMFCNLRNAVAQQIERIQYMAEVIKTLDTLQSLAEVADRKLYCRPLMDSSGRIEIKNGRHPVVETVSKSAFVPNNTLMDLNDERINIITGPNMAGKSTYLRQVALIVLMAQIGSFVPADEAHIGVVDRIFTRVGAADDLATGQSTFMVEMNEVANILNNATRNSLLILDEIGRGTSTFDGLSIAWAVVEHVADAEKLGAKTLFATHYHELTELEGKIAGVNNYCITVKEMGEDILFLRQIVRGGADNSYGIHVARLAGLPKELTSRAEIILSALNKADITNNKADVYEEGVVFYNKVRRKRQNDDLMVIQQTLDGIDE